LVKWFWPSIFTQFAEAGKRQSKSLTSSVDWLDSSLGPGELLLVVISYLFAVPVLVMGVGLEKSKELNLDVRNIFAVSHTV
jgi:hypothetical protein